MMQYALNTFLNRKIIVKQAVEVKLQLL